MTRVNCDGSGWTVIQETTPSGVGVVTHTGCEDYDWIVAEVSEVTTTSSTLVYVEIGYGGTPTYYPTYYMRTTTANSQFYGGTQWYYEGSNRTTVRRIALSTPNLSRNFNTTADPVQNPLIGSGNSSSSTSPGGMLGSIDTQKLPITTVRYSALAGNFSGGGGQRIRTWGWRG